MLVLDLGQRYVAGPRRSATSLLMEASTQVVESYPQISEG